MIFPIAKSLQLLPRSRAGSVPPGRIGRLFSALLTLNERGSVLCPLLNCDHMRPTCDFIRIAIISTNILLGRFLLSVGLRRNDGKNSMYSHTGSWSPGQNGMIVLQYPYTSAETAYHLREMFLQSLLVSRKMFSSVCRLPRSNSFQRCCSV